MDQRSCLLCHCLFDENALLPVEILAADIQTAIRKDCVSYSPGGFVCKPDLSQYTPLVSCDSSDENCPLYATRTELEAVQTFSDRCSDFLTAFVGSWPFIIIFCITFILWILINTYLAIFHVFDPYPFILLNLMLSVIAAIQAPIILMSQNRQAEIDRVRATYDYEIDLKAEMEVRKLHEKTDKILQIINSKDNPPKTPKRKKS